MEVNMKLKLLLLLMATTAVTTQEKVVEFQPGKSYRYDYKATTIVPENSKVYVSAKVDFIPIGEQTDIVRHCLMDFESLEIHMRSIAEGRMRHLPDQDLSKWSSIDINPDGTISCIHFPPGETQEVLNIKKQFASAFSAKLVKSHESIQAGQRWAYEMNETGHTGAHRALYQAEPGERSIIYRKEKPIEGIDGVHEHGHTKTVHLDHTQGLLKHIHIKEEVHTFRHISSMVPSNEYSKKYFKSGSIMGATSECRIMLESVETLSEEDFKEVQSRKPRSLYRDTLIIKEVPVESVPLTLLSSKISSNITCMLRNLKQANHEFSNCFQNLMELIPRLDKIDLNSMVHSYLFHSDQITKQLIIDVVGSEGSVSALDTLTQLVLKAEPRDEILVSRVFVHLANMKVCPPKKLRESLEDLVFGDQVLSVQTMSMARLALGSVIRKSQSCGQRWAQDMATRMEEQLGSHDQFKYETLKSSLTARKFMRTIEEKNNYILALGNANMDSSITKIISYLNSSDNHVLLKTGAMKALLLFNKNQLAADQLLLTAVIDKDSYIVRKAVEHYRDHPLGGDFALVEEIKMGLKNHSHLPADEYKRVRRSSRKIVNFLKKGFTKSIKSPSLDFRKNMGGDSKLGASIGIKIYNEIYLEFKALSGRLSVNIDDNAHAKLIVFGIELIIVQAQLCFKKDYSYNFNIFTEAQYDEIALRSAEYSKVVNSVVKNIRVAFENYKQSLEMFKGFSLETFIDNLKLSLQSLTKLVENFRTIPRKIRKLTQEYDITQLPIFMEIETATQDITKTLNDIKADVRGVHKMMADSVIYKLKWVWDEVTSTFNNAIKAIKNLGENPITAIYDIGESIRRFKYAMKVLQECMQTIKNANIFEKEDRPYWTNLSGKLKDLKEQLGALYHLIIQTKGQIRKQSRYLLFELFAEIDLRCVEEAIMDDIYNNFEESLAFFSDIVLTKVQPIKDFIQSVRSLLEIGKEIVENWIPLRERFQKAKAMVEEVFGTKVHKLFPRDYVDSCEDFGFWQSKGSGQYEDYPGIDVQASEREEIIAPFNGIARNKGNNMIEIEISDTFKAYLHNVQIYNCADDTNIAAGDPLGTVTGSGNKCSTNHVHLSLSKYNKTSDKFEFYEPSTFLEKKDLDKPALEDPCNHYVISFLDRVVKGESFMDPPVETDDSVTLENSPSASDMNVDRIDTGYQVSSEICDSDSRKRRQIGPTSMFGDLTLTNRDAILNMVFEKLPLKTIFDLAEQGGLTDFRETFLQILARVEEVTTQEGCSRPDSFDDIELQGLLTYRGLNASGTRDVLLKRYLESDPVCYGLGSVLGDGVYCSFSEDCYSLHCCTDILKFSYAFSITVFIQVDPCTKQVIVGLNEKRITFDIRHSFGYEGRESIEDGQFTPWQTYLNVKMDKKGDTLEVSAYLVACSSYSETCTTLVTIVDLVQFTIGMCTGDRAIVPNLENSPTTEEMLKLPVNEVVTIVDKSGENDQKLIEMLDDLREIIHDDLRSFIKTIAVVAMKNQFERFDVCARVDMPYFGPHTVEFFRQSIRLPLFPPALSLNLNGGSNGQYGVGFAGGLCAMSMEVQTVVTPFAVANVYGATGLTVAIITTEVRLTGQILSIKFPTKAGVVFRSSPSLKLRSDALITPYSSQFDLFVELGRGKRFSKTLYNRVIWVASETPIQKPLFEKRKQDPAGLPIFKGPCLVWQEPGLDYREPAFTIKCSAQAENSQVNMFYCVGTATGKCDVQADEPLSGSTTTISKWLSENGRPLYFRITAMNGDGAKVVTYCSIPTYDMTLPQGTVTPEFLRSSHPHILYANSLVTDDTAFVSREVGVGLGKGDCYGNTMKAIPVVEGNIETPEGPTALHKFTNARDGKLDAKPYKTVNEGNPDFCARACLAEPHTKCLSFNFEHGEGHCELMDVIETVEIKVLQSASGYFQHFEKLGIGHTIEQRYIDENLMHNRMYYFSLTAKNQLGYTNTLSSEGVLMDFSPPLPGELHNVSEDQFFFVKNIIDGPGSKTVFNGDKALVDALYTRNNRMMAANWDGFSETETSILMYTWSVGQSPCSDLIHPHKDPHAHLYDRSEWNNMGIVHPIDLEDGPYHLTVRAFSDVEFGGPMAVSVCHAQPYIVDTTAPIMIGVSNITYEEVGGIIQGDAYTYDPVSDIKSLEFGLGNNPRNTEVLDYTDTTWVKPVPQGSFIHTYNIPDGVPTWVKIRSTNNVDLRSVGFPEQPLLVDRSPPLKGTVFDGNVRGVDWEFQHEADMYCANWKGFVDAESGIKKYMVGMGTSPLADDVGEFVEVNNMRFSKCFYGLNLIHMARYYGTLVAFNGGHKELNTTGYSEGVTVDLTPPEPGWVKDGLDPTGDIEFSSNPGTVTSVYGGFQDPESNIASRDLLVYRQHKGYEEQMIHQVKSLVRETDSIAMHHFHFLHEDNIRTEVIAMNNARASTPASSSGVLIDLTDPQKNNLVDGLDPYLDLEYTTSQTELSCTWEFVDPESGIDHFRITAYEQYAGNRRQIFPASTPWRIVHKEATSVTTDEPLNLRLGALYVMRVAAVNKAGLTAVELTTGVTIDPTPPTMTYVEAGVLGEETEEVIDGYVIHNDREMVPARWRGLDPESGILEYKVAVGTSKGGQDVLEFTSMGTKMDGYITGLNLQFTDKTTNLPIYYVTVMATNGAIMDSAAISSSPIRVVEGDKAGAVFDGPAGSSIDYQLDTNTVTGTFQGFDSERDGIISYLWSLGTRPNLDDVTPFTSIGLVVDRKGQRAATHGIPNRGTLQATVPLKENTLYYLNLRATTGSGSILDSSSDGLTVDITPPKLEMRSIYDQLFGLQPNDTDDIAVEGVYQRDGGSITATWWVHDDESEVDRVTLTSGEYPGGDMSILHLSARQNSIPLGSGLTPLPDGKPTYLTFQTTNVVYLQEKVFAEPVTVDTTAPEAGIISCPALTGQEKITCTWLGFTDEESPISYFLFGIGTEEGLDDVYPFQKLDGLISSRIAQDFLVDLEEQKPYFATITCVNRVDLQVVAYSAAIIPDFTPPVGGNVIELNDEADVGANIQLDVNNITCGLECLDAVCQKSVSQLSVAWDPFTDPESGVVRYDVALGSTPGGTQIMDYTEVDHNGKYRMTFNIDLTNVRQVYTTVKSFNSVGLSSTVTSNGIFITKISAGLSPLEPIQLLDGATAGTDISFQEDAGVVFANWDLSGDPCPQQFLVWQVFRFDGVSYTSKETLPGDATNAMADGLILHEGESFYVVLEATNLLGHKSTLRSSGFTVRTEPLIPGIVRDGDAVGVDLNYWPRIDSLAANWDGFGLERPALGEESYKEDGFEAETDIGMHQAIIYYEVALGTDRRYPSTRNNVVPFRRVGLNKTHTFDHLNLVPKIAVYYVTVRAYGASGSMVEATSNGVRVGIATEVLKVGDLHLPQYIPTTSELVFSWSRFEFELPVLLYTWGMGLEDSMFFNLECGDVQRFEFDTGITNNENLTYLFDAKPLTSAGKGTYVTDDGLQLEHGATYHVVVTAMDESGACGMVSGVTTVDVTPPEHGDIYVGLRSPLEVLYTPINDSMSVRWENFTDPESGIEGFSISLWSGTTCDNNDDNIRLTNPMWLNFTETDFTFSSIFLKTDVPYFVYLNVTNRAGIILTAISRPILLDVSSPQSGDVKDGTDYMVRGSTTWQSDTDKMEGVLLYLPNPNGVACPHRTYSMTSPESDFRQFDGRHIYDISRTNARSINEQTFQTRQVSYDEENGLQLRLVRDVQNNRILAAAVQVTADILERGIYTIKPAEGVITSLIFSEPSEGYIYDYLDPFMWNYNPPTVTDKEVPTSREKYRGFGLQIVSAGDKASVLPNQIILWQSDTNKTYGVSADLPFDPSDGWRNYDFRINDGGTLEDDDWWTLSVFIDEVEYAEVAGATNLSSDALLTLTLYTFENEIYPLDDVFNPPTKVSMFRNLEFPPPSSFLCRYGTPFRGGNLPIQSFWAGVGSSVDSTDVKAFTQVVRPCIPCEGVCSERICDQTCANDQYQFMHIIVDGLDLKTEIEVDAFGNITLPEPYFLVVKAYAGSGDYVISSSRGIYVDVTPPNITELYHIDLAWDTGEPTLYQGNDFSIGAYWEAEDIESGVGSAWWAIGTYPGGSDIQVLTAIPEESTLCNNSELAGSIYGNMTYYVKLIVSNGAGINTTKISGGVLIDLRDPVLDDTQTQVEGAEPLNGPPVMYSSFSVQSRSMTAKSVKITEQTSVSTYKTKLQDSITVSWGEPSEPGIVEIYITLGTFPDKEDIVPWTVVGTNESDSVTFSANGMIIHGMGAAANMSDLNNRNKRDANTQFYLEPGRAVYSQLMACNQAHRCVELGTNEILILRDEDTLGKSQKIKMASQEITITQESNDWLAIGTLTEMDTHTEYVSDASDDYRPYVIDPVVTQDRTDRYLKHRISRFYGVNFFVTTLLNNDVAEGITIEFPIGTNSIYKETVETTPTVLAWCSDAEIWIEAERSCAEVNHNIIRGELAQIKVCDVNAYCSAYESGRIEEQSTLSKSYRGPVAFTVADVLTTYVNNPPDITSPSSYDIWENDDTQQFMIQATDPDGDKVTFALTDEESSSGIMSLLPDGTLHYTPKRFFFGHDSITLRVTDVPRIDDVEPMSTGGNVEINVQHVNNAPDIMYIVEGSNGTPETFHVTLSMEEDSGYNVAYTHLDIMVAAYDVDVGDDSQVMIQKGTRGETKVMMKEHGSVSVIPQDCSLVWQERSDLWEQLEQDMITDQPQVTLPFPCNTDPRVFEVSSTTWSTLLLQYRPNNGFYGVDGIKLIAKDKDGSMSDLLNIEIYVLSNRCKNNGTCNGGVSDKECEKLSRANGFDDYSCDCLPGYEGGYCETEIDECLSSPCPRNFTCEDAINMYFCKCENPDWPCQKIINRRQAAFVILVSMVVVAVVAALVLLFLIRMKNKNKINTEILLKAEEKELTISLTRNNKVAPFPDEEQEYHTKETNYEIFNCQSPTNKKEEEIIEMEVLTPKKVQDPEIENDSTPSVWNDWRSRTQVTTMPHRPNKASATAVKEALHLYKTVKESEA